MSRAQGSGAGDSEALVLLVPCQMHVTSDTSFITVSFVGSISEGCVGPGPVLGVTLLSLVRCAVYRLWRGHTVSYRAV